MAHRKRRLAGRRLSALVVSSILIGACGSDGSTADNSGNGTWLDPDKAPSSCAAGVPTKGGCCDPIQACGDVCCPAAQLCFFGACTTPGKDGLDESDCASDEYCDYSLHPHEVIDTPTGCSSGPKTGSCFPRPSNVEKCEVAPDASFELVEKYTLPGDKVWMTPLVMQLDDDNCDGVVDGSDLPEIIYAPGYDLPSPIIVMSISQGELIEKWRVEAAVAGGSQLASADLDDDGAPEIVGIGPDAQSVVAYRADGTLFWQATPPAPFVGAYEAPAIARVSDSGPPLVLANMVLLDGTTGSVVKKLAEPTWRAGGETHCGIGGYFLFGPWHSYAGFADLDGDGTLDVTDGARAFRVSGEVLWDFRDPYEIAQQRDRETGYHAVGDLDGDGVPEVIYTSYGRRTLNIVHLDPVTHAPTKLRGDLSLDLGLADNAGACDRKCTGGGPPTIADFNGDGTPDIGVAGAIGYIVFDGAKAMTGEAPESVRMWSMPTVDCSSAFTGSSVFDFDGDGRAEVVYADEHQLFVFDGATGERRNPETASPSSTVGEMPVIADVDGDDRADLLVPNDTGVHVFGSPTGAWVRTRRIWNQHTYHVTNVADDGSLPALEVANWTTTGLNNFRQNIQPGQEFLAPDASVTLAARCMGGYHLSALVRSMGQVPLPAGVVVEFRSGEPPAGELLGLAATTRPLSPGESETLSFIPKFTLEGDVYALVNAKPPPSGPLPECRSDNNQSPVIGSACSDQVK
jgi:hypothetical protein